MAAIPSYNPEFWSFLAYFKSEEFQELLFEGFIISGEIGESWLSLQKNKEHYHEHEHYK